MERNLAQPPFRADQIGSLLRPPALLDLRRRAAAGSVSEKTGSRPRSRHQGRSRDAGARGPERSSAMGMSAVTATIPNFFSKLGDLKPIGARYRPSRRSRHARPQPVALDRQQGRMDEPHPCRRLPLPEIAVQRNAEDHIPGPARCTSRRRSGSAEIGIHKRRRLLDDTSGLSARELTSLAEAGCTLVQNG